MHPNATAEIFAEATVERVDPRTSELRRRAQLANYTRQVPVNSIAGIVIATVAAVALAQAVPMLWVMAWHLTLSTIAVAMLAMWFGRRHARPDKPVSLRVYRKAIRWAALTGLLWGSAGLLVGALPMNASIVVFIAVIGMATGAATTLAAIPSAAAGFILCSLLPLCLGVLLGGGDIAAPVALMTGAFLLAMLAASRVVYRGFLDAVAAMRRTEQLADEFALAREEWLKIADSGEAFALLDADHRLMVWNRGLLVLLGRADDAPARGMRYRELLASTGGSMSVASGEQTIDAWLDEQEGMLDTANAAQVHQLANGSWIRSTAHRTEDGSIVVSHVDITALKLAHEHLEQQNREIEEAAHDLALARDKAERANRTKSAFLANMNHELRTPLGAIIGFAEIIEGEMFGPLNHDRYRDYVLSIGTSGRHLLEIVNNVLDMSKIEQHGLTLREGELDMRVLVDECAGLLHPLAQIRGVRVEVETPDDAVRLHADATRLRQIMLNLLSNAVKFTKSGGAVKIKHGLLPSGGYIVSVADTGIGMTQQDIEMALLPFQQVNEELSRDQEGTGLGLPLAKSLTELHGGTLQVASEFGRGTRVTIILPAARVLGADAPGEPMPPLDLSASHVQAA